MTYNEPDQTRITSSVKSETEFEFEKSWHCNVYNEL